MFYGPGAVQPNGSSALWFVNAVGNPKVNPEDATTYTAGFVFQPRWEHPLLAGFTSSVDWYRIVIDGMIAPEPGEAVYRACLSPESNPTFDVANEACQRIIRNPSTGGATATNVSYINAGASKLSGVDVTLDWKAEMADMGLATVGGNFGVNMTISRLLQLETQATRGIAGHRLGGQPRALGGHVAESWRVQVSPVHELQLRGRPRHREPALAASADGEVGVAGDLHGAGHGRWVRSRAMTCSTSPAHGR